MHLVDPQDEDDGYIAQDDEYITPYESTLEIYNANCDYIPPALYFDHVDVSLRENVLTASAVLASPASIPHKPAPKTCSVPCKNDSLLRMNSLFPGDSR